ncbi:MAG: hypothetical protein ACI38Q_04720 [Candidatus Bruticola sp.]
MSEPNSYAYVVETLEQADYSADELSDYLTQVSAIQGLRLVSTYVDLNGKLNLVWELAG